MGWVVAVLAGIVISSILRLLYGFFAEPPIERGEFTAAVMVISLVSGFLAYLMGGGYAAARLAGYAGGKHGALTAIFRLIAGIVLAAILSLFEILFAEGVAVPPVSFGLAGGALLVALLLFLVNLLGGYLGGKWGQPVYP